MICFFPLPMDLNKPFLGAKPQTDDRSAAPELDLSTHTETLRRLLDDPQADRLR